MTKKVFSSAKNLFNRFFKELSMESVLILGLLVICLFISDLEERSREAKIEAESKAANLQLVVDQQNNAIMTMAAKVAELESMNQALENKVQETRRKTEETNRGGKNYRSYTGAVALNDFRVEATAYDSDYMTADGTVLSGHSLESARVIAVDPSVIPLGSMVYVEFEDEQWQHCNGIYRAADTGGAIVGNRIDVYFGDGAAAAEEAMRFGRRMARVSVMEQ